MKRGGHQQIGHDAHGRQREATGGRPLARGRNPSVIGESESGQRSKGEEECTYGPQCDVCHGVMLIVAENADPANVQV